MQNIPPINWEDLIRLGLPAESCISYSEGIVSVIPIPPKIISKLIAAAMSNPPPLNCDRITYLRHIRDLLISLTDWTQARDVPLSDMEQTSWAEYRQQLRDLPQTYVGAGPIPWPNEPN